MDEQRKTLIVTGAVLLIILALVISLIFFLARFISSRRQSTNNPQISSTSTQAPSPTASGSTNQPSSSQNQLGSTKSFQGSGFSLNYPQNWGLLTCNNSQNFEFDLTNPQDQKGFTCDRAVKPITFLVLDNLSCQGDGVTIGNLRVVRSVEGTKGAEANYRWCVINPNGFDLDITHRVSNSSKPASSKEDFAPQIEQVIQTINFSR